MVLYTFSAITNLSTSTLLLILLLLSMNHMIVTYIVHDCYIHTKSTPSE